MGVYSFGCAVGHATMMVFGYTYLNSSNSPVLGGILPVLAALLWHYMKPLESDGKNHCSETHSFWD